jgi:hypothetical protein
MDDRPKPKPQTREAARAEALRANLLRRKAQARGRDEGPEMAKPEPPAGA